MRWDELRRPDMRHEKRGEELRRAELTQTAQNGEAEMSWKEKSSDDQMSREEMQKAQATWEVEMRPAVSSWEELRKGENTRDVRWDDVKNIENTHDMITRWHEMRWGEMRWDDTDFGDNGMQWAMSKRSCDVMRSDETRKDPTFKRNGIRLTSQEIVAAKHRRLVRTVEAHLLFRSKCYRCFDFEASAPACPGATCTHDLSNQPWNCGGLIAKQASLQWFLVLV